MSPAPRVFAVVPAAGLSRRMGRPKLLLTLHGETIISRLLTLLQRPPVEDVVVVVRRSDPDLIAAAQATGGNVVTPDRDPPDMRASVEAALRDLQQRHSPADDDLWLLVPADHPVLEPDIVPELLVAWRSLQPDILIPTYRGQRGHPALLRWRLVRDLAVLPPDQGLNALRQIPGIRVAEHAVQTPGVVFDLDTPADWERLNRIAGASEPDSASSDAYRNPLP